MVEAKHTAQPTEPPRIRTPGLPLRSDVLLPGPPLSLTLRRPLARAAALAADPADPVVVLLFQKDPANESGGAAAFLPLGVSARVLGLQHAPDGALEVLLHPRERVSVARVDLVGERLVVEA